jgi:HlyD family secretion protein
MSINQKNRLIVIKGRGAMPHVKSGVNVADELKEPIRSNAAIEGPDSLSPGPAGRTDVAPLPQQLPMPRVARRFSAWARIILVLATFGILGGGGAVYWWQHLRSQLPAGIVWSNGRLEADEIDINTKFAGRLVELLVNEGDFVRAGQVVARMDSRDLEASLRHAQAQVRQAQKAVDETNATLEQQRSQLALAQQQLDRTAFLAQRGNATQELLDERQQQRNAATALLSAVTARVAQAEHALAAAESEVERYQITIGDNTLTAPRDGRVQYRIVNVGEVLPAGGKVVTMIDITSVYMDLFLPTSDAGKAAVGTDARIVLDAYPDRSIPAKVSFLATQSQFTPKTVETRSERDRLMFRVRVRVDPELLRAYAEKVRSGLPGVAYLRLDPKVAWPVRIDRTIAQ